MQTREPTGVTASPPAREQRTRHSVTGTLVGTLLALLVVLLVPAASAQNNPLVVGVGAYAAFVCGLMITGRIQRRASRARRATQADGGVLDLAGLEQEEREEATPYWPTTEMPTVPGGILFPPAIDFPDDRPTKQRNITRDDVVDAGLAAAAAAAIALLQHFVTDADGLLGLAIVWYIAFLAVFYVIVRDRSDAEAATDRLVTTLVWSVGLLVLAVLTWMLVFLVGKGLAALRPGFFTEDLSQVGPLTPGGGAFHAIVGTVEQVGIAITIVVPIAVLTAVYLNEIKGRMAKPVRFIVDAMSGLPSIVAGLLIFTVYVDGRGFSGIAGSMALIVLMLPTVTRASEEILRTIPDALRESSLALGAPQWRVTMRVVVPTAMAGLVTATILGIARAVGETAPMLLTAFGSDTTNWNPLKGPQSDLPLFVLKLYRVPNAVQNQRAYTGLLVLVMLVLVLFVTARAIANRGARKLRGAR